MNLIHPIPQYKDGRFPGISSGYLDPSRKNHVGVDLFYPRIPEDGGVMGELEPPTRARKWYMPFGVPVFAMMDGIVTEAYLAGKGEYVVIEHAGGWRTQYMHLDDRYVKAGDRVSAGDKLGTVGNDRAGKWSLNHLHLQMRKDGRLVDPARYLQVAQIKPWPTSPLLYIGILGAVVGGYYLLRKA